MEPRAFREGPGGVEPRRMVQVGVARVVEVPRAQLPRSVPVLTVYADGFVESNTEAAALLSQQATGVCFHAPAPVRAGRSPKPWQVSAGACHLFSRHADKWQVRFRAAGDCPPAGRYVLTPQAGRPDWFTLLPA